MGLFGLGKNKNGGILNVIRCDEEAYMVWKWRPEGADANSTKRENAIRYGSSLRVKDGEVAVFVYKQANGTMQDFIVGPYDDTIKTANFPVLSGIVGLAFGGDSPFQAEIYFINLQGNNKVTFAIPYFDVVDPRLPDYPVPVSVRGSITFAIEDYKQFIKLNRLVDFDHEAFLRQIKDAMSRKIKGIVSNVPSELGIPAVQVERKIDDISQLLEERLRDRLDEYGVKMKYIDINSISIDKESEAYLQVKEVTGDITARTLKAQADVNILNMQQMQQINAANLEETLRIQREEAQRAQRLQTETTFLGAHALDRQADVMTTAAQNLGSMGQMSGGGMNPAGMMTGMMVGGAMGTQMAGMMNNLGQQMQTSMQAPPPVPNVQFNVAVNGQATGPYTVAQLQQMYAMGQFNAQSMVWRQGMAQWQAAGQVAELASVFAAQTPPPVPPSVPPTVPPAIP